MDAQGYDCEWHGIGGNVDLRHLLTEGFPDNPKPRAPSLAAKKEDEKEHCANGRDQLRRADFRRAMCTHKDERFLGKDVPGFFLAPKMHSLVRMLMQHYIWCCDNDQVFRVVIMNEVRAVSVVCVCVCIFICVVDI
jgi:hypothetical protein